MFGSKNRQNDVVDFVRSKDKNLSNSLDRFGYFLIATFAVQIFSLCASFGTIFSMRQLIAAGSPPVVELADGTTIETVALRGDERPLEVIKEFVNEAAINLFTWRSTIKSSEEKKSVEYKNDPGVEVDFGFKKVKIPTAAWQQSFALDPKLQSGFLQKIAQIIDSLSPNGPIETVLQIQRVGEPKQMGKGIWTVALFCHSPS
jgi:hypothetical protein